MKKKLCHILLITVICCGILAGCGRKTEKKEDVTLIIKMPSLIMNSVSNPDILEATTFLQQAGEAFAAQYEEANVTIQIETFDYIDEIKAITDSFDTEDATDILYEGYFNMASYIHTGRVVPLDDIISSDLRNDIDDATWAMSMVDGKTYMMPFSSMQNILIYNKNHFQSCGLEKYISNQTEIQNWTMEEWTEILDTLAEELPDRTYPMMMYGKNNQGDTHIMTLMRAYGSPFFDEAGNFDVESREAVQALEWIQEGVSKGWYPPHPENLEISDCNELFSNGQLSIYTFNNASFVLYDNIEDYGFVNFPGNLATSFVTGFEVFDNGDDIKTKAAKDFILFIYENEEWLDISAGNIPACRSVAEKYKDQINMLEEFVLNAENVVDFMNNSPNWQGNDTSVRSVFWPGIHDMLSGAITPQECAETLNKSCNAALQTGRENSRLHE